ISRKVFIFPKWSSKTSVSLITQLEKPLQKFTPKEPSSGTAKLWVNRQLWARKGLKQGYSVGTHPIWSWGRSRIPTEVGLMRTRPLWEGLDWAFVSVHLQKRLTGLCVEVSSSAPVSWSGGHQTVKCR
ncbi:APCS, partial [Cervus elaphus hippelaphus]